jgi:hypothetical protein
MKEESTLEARTGSLDAPARALYNPFGKEVGAVG